MRTKRLGTVLALLLAVGFLTWPRVRAQDSPKPERAEEARKDEAAGPLPAEKVGGSRPQILRPGDPHAHGLTDEDLDALRAILRKAVDDRVVPGVSLLLAHRGEVIFKEAFGNLGLDQKAQMASSSKPVTATLLMILVDRGKLALDDPIEKYLPEFQGM